MTVAMSMFYTVCELNRLGSVAVSYKEQSAGTTANSQTDEKEMCLGSVCDWWKVLFFTVPLHHCLTALN